MPEKLDLYYDHYKDSFDQIKSNIIRREHFFLVAVLSFFGSVLVTVNPSFIEEISNAFGKSQLGIDLHLTVYTVNSLLIFLSLWYIVRYYQSVLSIENLYSYIHQLEAKLCALIKDFEICREGKSYLASYPILKSCIHFFYFTIFPSIIIIAYSTKIYWELCKQRVSIPKLALAFDIFCMVIIIVLTVLYMSWLHFKDFRKTGVKE